MHADLYSVNNHLWYIDVKLPAGQSVEYKYVRKEGGSVTWESGSNRVLKVPDSCDHSVSTGDSWR
ncbi:hypothetical protein KEM52_000364 [Ascosphaera acerosa]|nr:hypothetical protein KEM52_000364 [Ascosphaera acerosa]